MLVLAEPAWVILSLHIKAYNPALTVKVSKISSFYRGLALRNV